MKIVVIIYLLLHFVIASSASPGIDSLTNNLNKAIENAKDYDNNKLKEISRLKQLLTEFSQSDIDKQYATYLMLYEEYKYYNYDSALTYANKLQQFAKVRNNSSLLADAKLKVAFIMLSAGRFKETFDSLNVISVKDVTDSVKAEYYSVLGRSYYSLADFNSDSVSGSYYNNKANLYLDSALALYAPDSFDHPYYSALQFLKKGYPDSALSVLNKLIERQDLSKHQIALAMSTIGGIYLSKGNRNQAKPYFIQASIADIESSTKETWALLALAETIYREGNLEQALLYIEKANADAEFYNARLRKVQIGSILPLIEGEMINTIKTQKQKLQLFLLLLSILVLLLGAFAVIIRKQLKKLKVARVSLVEANIRQREINQELMAANELKEKYNSQLKEINDQLVEANKTKEKYNVELKEINRKLLESNKIKEEYIGYYFNIDTEFLTRMEKLINLIDKKLVERRWDEIKLILKSVDPKKEKNDLLKNFDKVFLRLFPNFVSQFNTLFKDEDKITPKEEQLLNTDLRIFALIRLGITDNEKIAEILNYSINTIYAKKTKVRSKTIINKEDFENKIMEITTLSF